MSLSSSDAIWLCIFDAAGIQRYVFGSNRLRHNAGASLLVDRAFRDWLPEQLETILPGRVGNRAEAFRDEEIDALVVLNVGGAAQVVFRDEGAAREAVTSLGERALCEAPGLLLVACVSEWPAGGSYPEASAAAHRELAVIKTSGVLSASPFVPGVVERCAETGEPASARRDGRWVSDSVLARVKEDEPADLWIENLARRAARAGRNALTEALAAMQARGLRFSSDIDQMRGRQGESSFVGVIHADADGMGDRFRQLTRGLDDVGAIGRLQLGSRSADLACADAIAAAIDWVVGAVRPGKGGEPTLFEQIPLSEHRLGGHVLPVRPIVAAGDDLTVVSEGSIALDLAAELGRALSAAIGHEESPFESVTVSVGVGLGHAHSPFWRLYELAERSCRGAKDARLKSSSMAWRFLGEADVGTACRPPVYTIGKAPSDLWSWQTFRTEALDRSQNAGERAHTSLKKLGEAFRLGDIARRARLEREIQRMTQREDPAIAALSYAIDHRGKNLFFLQNETTPYADAFDLMDFCVRIPRDDSSAGTS